MENRDELFNDLRNVLTTHEVGMYTKMNTKEVTEILVNTIANLGDPVSKDDALSFEQELTRLINKHSIDSYVNTNDFFIASAIKGYLDIIRNLLTEHEKMRETERQPNIQMVKAPADFEGYTRKIHSSVCNCRKCIERRGEVKFS